MLSTIARLIPMPFGRGISADLAWITPDLAQSDRIASRQAPALARLAIGALLDLRAEARHQPELLAKAGIHYLHLAVPDHGAPSETELAHAADWVLQELGDDRKVLVHCRLGRGRSVVVVAAVLVRMGYPLADAMALVRRRRPDAILSDAQVAVLNTFAESLGT